MNDGPKDEGAMDEPAIDDEAWVTLATQLGFALEQRDRDPDAFLLDVDRERGEVALRTGEAVPGERITFSLTPEDFDRTLPRRARAMVAAALGPEG